MTAALAKATLQGVVLAPDGGREEPRTIGSPIPIQFAPETLRLSAQNSVRDADRGGAATQHVARRSRTLAVTLWFDATVPADGREVRDVRDLTDPVTKLLDPDPVTGSPDAVQAVRFLWGAILFDGLLERVDETLELFSADGRPLRSQLALSFLSPTLQLTRPPAGGAGTNPVARLGVGEALADAVARAGGGDWHAVAAANGIDDPRRLLPGTVIDL